MFTVPLASILAPPVPAIPPAPLPTAAPPPLPDPVIVPPPSSGISFNMSDMFQRPYTSRAVAWPEIYALAVLCELANGAGTIENGWANSVASSLNATDYTRNHVNDEAGLWFDEWKFSGGKEVIVFPCTQKRMQWLTYQSPGMSDFALGETTQRGYTGILLQLAQYRAYFAANWTNDRINRASSYAMAGHSLGASVAQFIAADWNTRFPSGSEPDVRGPVTQVVSFGMPCTFAPVVGIASFTPRLRHLRFYNPGDTVTDLPAFAVGATKSTVSRAVDNLLKYDDVPRHHSSLDLVIAPDFRSRVAEAENNFNLVLAKRTRELGVPNIDSPVLGTYWDPEITAARMAALAALSEDNAGTHAVTNYVDRMEIQVRQSGSAPYPLFTQLVAAVRAKRLGLNLAT